METKTNALEIATLITCLLIIVGYISHNYSHFLHGPVTYDCRLVEISPDIPPEVKEQCRRLQGVRK